MIRRGVAGFTDPVKGRGAVCIIGRSGVAAEYHILYSAVRCGNAAANQINIGFIGIMGIMTGFAGHALMVVGMIRICFDMATGTNCGIVGRKE